MVDVAKLNVQLFDLNGEFNDVLRSWGRSCTTPTGASARRGTRYPGCWSGPMASAPGSLS